MKKFLVICVLGALSFVGYKSLTYKKWEDPSWIKECILSIKPIPFSAQTPDIQEFIQEFPRHSSFDNTLIWNVFDYTRKHAPEYVFEYANFYANHGFAMHHSKENVPMLATIGGELLKKNSFDLAARYFEVSFNRGKENFDQRVLGEWAFFTGYSFERGKKEHKAIEWYKKSIAANDRDYRPYRQIGLLYYGLMSKDPNNLANKALARKYFLLSLKIKKDQPEIKKLVQEMALEEASSIQKPSGLNQNRVQIGVPRPIPHVPHPEPVLPNPSKKSSVMKFNRRHQ